MSSIPVPTQEGKSLRPKPWQGYLAAVRYFDRSLVEEVLLKDVAGAPPFDRLVRNIYIEELRGLPGYYQMERSFRESYFRSWWPDDALEEDLSRVPRELRALSCRLAASYAARGDTREQLYHLIAGNPRQARALFRRLYDSAEGKFDLAACHALLLVLEERQALLTRTLEQELREKRLRLKARSQWAQEYYQTTDYVEREVTQNLMPELIEGKTHWILNLYAPFGMGKSSFIRASIARYCVPLGIPCARIDFYDKSLILEVAEPWRLLLRVADQFKNQLPWPAFQSLLADYGHYINRSGAPAIQPPRAGELAVEILERFIQDMHASNQEKSYVIVFDTLEELRHRKVDMQPAITLMQELRQKGPGLRVILSGRYSQEDVNQEGELIRAAGFVEEFGGQERNAQLKPFDEREARAYLEQREMKGDPRLEAIIAKCTGDPIKLSLLADVVAEDPDLSADEIRSFPTVDLIYLVDRVIKRIDDRTVRWLVRYGVVPRQLTLDFVETVMLPYIQRAETGDTTYDDPRTDPVPEHVRKDGYFEANENTVGTSPPDARAAWGKLTQYASEASWVSYVSGDAAWLTAAGSPVEGPAAEVLLFQPHVVEPMQYLLQQQRARGRDILIALHRDAMRYFERRAAEVPANAPTRARWLQEALFHQFQMNDPKASVTYWRRQIEAAQDPETVRALAEEAIIQSKAQISSSVEEEGAKGQASRVMEKVRAQAAYELARLKLSLEGPPFAQLRAVDWLDIKDWLAIIQPQDPDGLQRTAPGITFPQAAYIRGHVLLAEGEPEKALALAREALQDPTDESTRMELHLLTAAALARLPRAPGETRAVQHYQEALELAKTVAGHRVDRITEELGRSLERNDKHEQAAAIYQNLWEEARSQGDLACMARRLVDHIRVLNAMGREGAAAAAALAGVETLNTARQAGGAATEAFDPAWLGVLKAEAELAAGRPAAARKELFAALHPQLDVGPIYQEAPEAWRMLDADLRSRIDNARLAIGECAACCEKMAYEIYGPDLETGQRPRVLATLLDLAALYLGPVVDLLQAGRYLAEAQASEDKVTVSLGWAARRELLEIRRKTIAGKEIEAQKFAKNLWATMRENSRGTAWPPGLQVQVALEWVIQSGANLQALVALSEVLGTLEPASRRLAYLADGLQRCANPAPAGSKAAARILSLLPEETEGQDPAMAALRWSEVERVLGRAEQARARLKEADAACREPLRLARLRQVYLGWDRLGWESSELQAVSLPPGEESLWGECTPGKTGGELPGAFLLEHAERRARVLGDLQGATALLERAAPLLGDHPQSLWGPRITALRTALTLGRAIKDTDPAAAPVPASTTNRNWDQALEALAPALGNFKVQGNQVGALQALDLILSVAERSCEVCSHDVAALAHRIGRIFYDLGEMDEAVAAFQEAVRRSPAGSPDLPVYHNSLGAGLRARYVESGRESDLTLASRAFQEAVNLTSTALPLAAQYLNNLGAVWRDLYIRTGAPRYLERSIETLTRAAQMASQSASGLALSTSNLSTSLQDRYHLSGSPEFLEKAIVSLRRVVGNLPENAARLPGYSALATALRTRYARSGNKEDLEESIRTLRQAVQSLPSGAPELAEAYNNLGAGLRDRYAAGGKLADLDEAIQSFEQAVSRTPSGSALLPGYLSNLGASLHDRYLRSGQLKDLEAAIHALRQAVQNTPPESPARPAVLNNLGRSLRDRSARQGNIRERAEAAASSAADESLEEAIACFEAALKGTEATSPDRATYLINLGQAFASRLAGDRAQNLEKAIQLYLEALQSFSPDVYPAHWALAHNNLGQAFASRLRDNRQENLERAIHHYQKALTVRSREAFPADWALTQVNLGFALAELPAGDAPTRETNLRRSIACFQKALEVYTLDDYPDQWEATRALLQRVESELENNSLRVAEAEGLQMAGLTGGISLQGSQNIGTVEAGGIVTRIAFYETDTVGEPEPGKTAVLPAPAAGAAVVVGVRGIGRERLRKRAAHRDTPSVGRKSPSRTASLLVKACDRPSLMISLRPVSAGEWEVRLGKVQLDGEAQPAGAAQPADTAQPANVAQWITRRVRLPEGMQRLFHAGTEESFSPAFVREFATSWAATGARLGELMFPKGLQEEFLEKEGPYLLFWVVEAHSLGWLPWEMLPPSAGQSPFGDSPFVLRSGLRTTRAREDPAAIPAEPPAVDVLLISSGQPSHSSAASEGSAQSGQDLLRLYASQGLRVEVIGQLETWNLAGSIERLRPRVVHIVAPLRARGARQALDFAANVSYGKQEKQISPRDLANVLSKSWKPPVVVLDPPSPPWIHERLRQLCLRNAFAAELAAAASYPLGVLATGLAEQKNQQAQLYSVLAEGLGEQRALIEIAHKLRRTAGDPAHLEQVLPFLGTAVFCDDPLHGLELTHGEEP